MVESNDNAINSCTYSLQSRLVLNISKSDNSDSAILFSDGNMNSDVRPWYSSSKQTDLNISENINSESILLS